MPASPRRSRKSRRKRFSAETHDQVSFNGAVIEYRLRRSSLRKKTVQIRFEPDGLLICAPARASDEKVRAMVLRWASWIVDRMFQPLRFVTGETLPYLGRNVELIVKERTTSCTRVSLRNGKLHLSVSSTLAGDDRLDNIRKAFAAWYSARAQDHIPREVKRWWPRLGVKKKSRVLIGSQRSKWGSCSFDGTLRFSWRTMMLPPEIIEYIVVHELSHLTVFNHSPKFWEVVTRALPDAKARRKLQREVGAVLPL